MNLLRDVFIRLVLGLFFNEHSRDSEWTIKDKEEEEGEGRLYILLNQTDKLLLLLLLYPTFTMATKSTACRRKLAVAHLSQLTCCE